MKHNNKFTLKGQFFYLAAIALIGLMASLENFLIYGGLFLAATLIHKNNKSASATMLKLYTSCFLIFLAVGYHQEISLSTSFKGDEETFILLFDTPIKLDGNSMITYAQSISSKEKVAVTYRIDSQEEREKIKNTLLPGMACKASGSLEIPSVSRNPNSFDYQNYLSKKQIFWTLKIDQLNLDDCKNVSNNILAGLRRHRQREIYVIEERFPKETAALAAALIYGDRSLFNPETERSFQKIGIIHLLAISGLHVALIAGMLSLIFLRVGFTREKTEMLLLIFLPIFAILTGFAAPVIRTSLMLMLLIIIRRFRMKLTPLDAISFTFMVIVLIQPMLIYEIGFQLSFSVSFSLVLSAQKILKSYPSPIFQSAVISIIAQLSSLPIILSSFYEISIISLIANLLFVPLFTFILLPLVMFAYMVISLTGDLPAIFFRLLEELIHLINRFSAMLAELPGSTLILGKPGNGIFLMIIFLLPVFFVLWEKKYNKWIFLLPMIPLIIQMLFPYINPYGKITFIDVGQGDSILIQLPHNQGNYLIDTGGTINFAMEEWQERKQAFDPGRDVVLPLLKSEGIAALDKLILTHGDGDHIGGSAAIMSEIKVKQLILPRLIERSSLEKEILKQAGQEGTAIYFGGAGTTWSTAHADFKLLSPIENSDDRNENSIVLFAEFGGKKWLFTGDLGMNGEQLLLDKYEGIDIDVLKVGHHGSKSSTSAEFIEEIKPEHAIISAGMDNRYGHPHAEVLQRLENFRIQTLRTDKNGAIIYVFKNETGTFFTQIP